MHILSQATKILLSWIIVLIKFMLHNFIIIGKKNIE